MPWMIFINIFWARNPRNRNFPIQQLSRSQTAFYFLNAWCTLAKNRLLQRQPRAQQPSNLWQLVAVKQLMQEWPARVQPVPHIWKQCPTSFKFAGAQIRDHNSITEEHSDANPPSLLVTSHAPVANDFCIRCTSWAANFLPKMGHC